MEVTIRPVRGPRSLLVVSQGGQSWDGARSRRPREGGLDPNRLTRTDPKRVSCPVLSCPASERVTGGRSGDRGAGPDPTDGPYDDHLREGEFGNSLGLIGGSTFSSRCLSFVFCVWTRDFGLVLGFAGGGGSRLPGHSEACRPENLV